MSNSLGLDLKTGRFLSTPIALRTTHEESVEGEGFCVHEHLTCREHVFPVTQICFMDGIFPNCSPYYAILGITSSVVFLSFCKE